jgi:hypothetical protein
MSDISPSKVQHSLATLTTYNNGKVLNLKGFMAKTAGLVEYTDAEGATHSFTATALFIPPIAGRISITANTVAELLIFL